MNRLFPSCKELAERLSRGEYERAPLLQRAAARWHLARCALCRRYEEQLRLVADAYRRQVEDASSADAAARKKRLLDKLRG